MGNGTSIGRVRALGSAHSGSHHWLMQRFTAIANLLLGLWLAISLLRMGDYSYASMQAWLHHPLAALLLALFAISSFWHARLGLQVLVEDYVHESGNKFAVMALLNLLSFGGAAAAVFFLLQVVIADVSSATTNKVAPELIKKEMQKMMGGR